jgi:hypothetical protein
MLCTKKIKHKNCCRYKNAFALARVPRVRFLRLAIGLRTRSRPASEVTDRPPACIKNSFAVVFNLDSFKYRFTLCWFHYNSGISNKSTNAPKSEAVLRFSLIQQVLLATFALARVPRVRLPIGLRPI